ncbi:Coronin-7 [Chytriomyces hyalinus]|nr:Coronin-7 [Chytriomyces hyalinus]
MKNRFTFSPFRNAVLKESHRESWTVLGANANVGEDGMGVIASGGCGVVVACPGGVRVLPESTTMAQTENATHVAVRGSDIAVLGAAGLSMHGSGGIHTMPNPVAQCVSLHLHPFARSLVGLCALDAIVVADFDAQATRVRIDAPTSNAHFQSFAFSLGYAATIAASSKDNRIRLFDVRDSGKEAAVSEPHHMGVKPSSVHWINDTALLTAGFSKMRDRELALWDSRSMAKPVVNYKLDTSTGRLIPLFDPDSGLLFVTGKGDSAIRTYEVSQTALTATPNNLILSQTINNAVLVSKSALNVMDCEVARLMVLASDMQTLIPISANVLRKNKMDFQQDLFPDTFSDEAIMSADSWFNGDIPSRIKIKLDPRAQSGSLTEAPAHPSTTFTTSTPAPAPLPVPVHPSPLSQQSSQASITRPFVPYQPVPLQAPAPITDTRVSPQSVRSSTTATEKPSDPKLEQPTASQSSPKTGPRFSQPAQTTHSTFKYIQGTSTPHLFDLKTGNPTLPNECCFLDVNGPENLAAFPVSGGGGRICIYPTSQPGRFPAKLPCIVTGSEISDFGWSTQSKKSVLYTLTDDGILRTWQLSSLGMDLTHDLTEPRDTLKVNPGKSGVLAIHPFVEGLVCVSSSDPRQLALRCWDACGKVMVWEYALMEAALCAAFSSDGEVLVSFGKDGKVRVLDAKKGSLLEEGVGFEGVKGARVAWIPGTQYFAACGFGRANQRELKIYNSKNLTQVAVIGVEMSPSLITPYVDESLPIIYLVGKGESYIQIFHIDIPSSESTGTTPVKLTKCATYTSPHPQLAVSFLPKSACAVRDVEIATGFRLFATGLERLSFKLPRLRKEVFQDDVFPALRLAKRVGFEAWIVGGETNEVDWDVVDLCPEGMERLSDVKSASTPRESQTRSSVTIAVELSEEKKKLAAMEQMKRLAMADEGKMVQDLQEGVDEDEWD